MRKLDSPITKQIEEALNGNIPVPDMTDDQLVALESNVYALQQMLPVIVEHTAKGDPIRYVWAMEKLERALLGVLLEIHSEISNRPSLMKGFQTDREKNWAYFRALSHGMGMNVKAEWPEEAGPNGSN